MAAASRIWSGAWIARSKTGSGPRAFSLPLACCLRSSKLLLRRGCGDEHPELHRLLLVIELGLLCIHSPRHLWLTGHIPYNHRMTEQPLVGVVMGSKSDYEVLSAA